MKIDHLSDERLVSLHRQKKIAIFFVLYNRYRSYGYAIVAKTLRPTNYYNALVDEKDALVYDALNLAVKTYDKTRGNFRVYFGVLLTNITSERIRQFARDPLADYISIDEGYKESAELKYMDALTFADKGATPPQAMNYLDEAKRTSESYHAHGHTKTAKIIHMKEEGYTVSEIAKKHHVSPKAVSSLFYRIKKQKKQRLPLKGK